MSSKPTIELSTSFNNMALAKESKSAKAKNADPVDSWEDDAEDGSGSEADGTATPVRTSTSDMPAPPPPTPASPVNAQRRNFEYQAFEPLKYGGSFDAESYSTAPGRSNYKEEERRPDKTTSVASRLIAAGIGQKAPKRTQEQREYDQAMKVQEKKKRDQAKEEEDRKKREKEQAQKDIWGE